VGFEAADGLELEVEFVVGSAFVVVEDELVGGGGEGEGEALERAHGGLGGALLVAMDLGLVELDEVVSTCFCRSA
jgi:hypothetical protein